MVVRVGLGWGGDREEVAVSRGLFVGVEGATFFIMKCSLTGGTVWSRCWRKSGVSKRVGRRWRSMGGRDVFLQFAKQGEKRWMGKVDVSVFQRKNG